MSAQLNALSLSSLLASRLCHDLVNPVGALSAGLEVMEDEADPDMQEAAQNLIKESTQKSIAMLSFARIAFGAGGAYGSEIDIQEGKAVLEQLYKYVKADLVWKLPEGIVQKNYCKAVLNIALVVADCVPRAGSVVTLSGDRQCVTMTAQGPRAKLKDELQRALSGDPEGLEAKMTPAYLASLVVKELGGTISAELVNEELIEVKITFPE